MTLLSIVTDINGTITILNHDYPSDFKTLQYNEDKYPGGSKYQVIDWLKEKGYKVIGSGWDEVNGYNFAVVERFTYLLNLHN